MLAGRGYGRVPRRVVALKARPSTSWAPTSYKQGYNSACTYHGPRKGSLVVENHFFQGNLGWWNIWFVCWNMFYVQLDFGGNDPSFTSIFFNNWVETIRIVDFIPWEPTFPIIFVWVKRYFTHIFLGIETRIWGRSSSSSNLDFLPPLPLIDQPGLRAGELARLWRTFRGSHHRWFAGRKSRYPRIHVTWTDLKDRGWNDGETQRV